MGEDTDRAGEDKRRAGEDMGWAREDMGRQTDSLLILMLATSQVDSQPYAACLAPQPCPSSPFLSQPRLSPSSRALVSSPRLQLSFSALLSSPRLQRSFRLGRTTVLGTSAVRRLRPGMLAAVNTPADAWNAGPSSWNTSLCVSRRTGPRLAPARALGLGSARPRRTALGISRKRMKRRLADRIGCRATRFMNVSRPRRRFSMCSASSTAAPGIPAAERQGHGPGRRARAKMGQGPRRISGTCTEYVRAAAQWLRVHMRTTDVRPTTPCLAGRGGMMHVGFRKNRPARSWSNSE